MWPAVVLTLLLGLLVPVYAGPPQIAPVAATQASDDRLVLVTQIYLLANRAHGPPSGAVLLVPARTSRGSAGASFVLNGSQVIQERDMRMRVAPAAEASDGTYDPDAPPPAGSILRQPGTRHLNLQPAASAIPTGWLADKGRALDVRTNGLTYGWVDGHAAPAAQPTEAGLARGIMPQPELDTAQMTPAPGTGGWRMALPNGTYAVVVIAGDAASTAHSNHLVLNGTRLGDPDPYDPAEPTGYQRGDFDGWAVDVMVTDGYLTIAGAADALDPALCLVEIGPQGSHVDQETRDRLSDAITAATARTAEPPFRRPPTPRTFVYGGDYIDAPIAMKAGSGPDVQYYYIHAGRVYSPSALTDAHGQVVERYTYDAYGRRTILDRPSANVSAHGLAFGFTGLRDEDGLLFARNRYFAPDLGRWISRDPAGYVDGYGLYGGYFVPNANDPEGKSIPFVPIVIGVAIVGAIWGIYKLYDATDRLMNHADEFSDYRNNLFENPDEIDSKSIEEMARIIKEVQNDIGDIAEFAPNTIFTGVVAGGAAVVAEGIAAKNGVVACEKASQEIVKHTGLWFDRVAREATRNAGSKLLVLGHYAHNGGVSYQKVAAHLNATYFKIENWTEVVKGMTREEIWKINETFLRQQLAQGKKVLFSHNPMNPRPNSFFAMEVQFLRDIGYVFKQKNQFVWEARLP